LIRAEVGDLWFSADVEQESLERGAAAAVQHLEAEGVDVRAALLAYERRHYLMQEELAWEAGEAEMPEDMSEAEHALADIAEEAWCAALAAAGVEQGEIGLVGGSADQPVFIDGQLQV